MKLKTTSQNPFILQFLLVPKIQVQPSHLMGTNFCPWMGVPSKQEALHLLLSKNKNKNKIIEIGRKHNYNWLITITKSKFNCKFMSSTLLQISLAFISRFYLFVFYCQTIHFHVGSKSYKKNVKHKDNNTISYY